MNEWHLADAAFDLASFSGRGGESMSSRFRKLFSRTVIASDAEPLGEDMAPSPLALAERSALSTENSDADSGSASPFSSAAPAPIRDYAG